MWQILLLAAGFLVLVAISVGLVSCSSTRRATTAAGSCTPSRSRTRPTRCCSKSAGPKARARGYLLTSGPEFLGDHEEAVAQIHPDLDKLAELIARQSGAASRISSKMRAAIETRLGQFAQEMDFVKQGEPDKATALVREAAAGDTTSTIRDVGAAMRDEESRLLGAANTTTPTAARSWPPR